MGDEEVETESGDNLCMFRTGSNISFKCFKISYKNGCYT